MPIRGGDEVTMEASPDPVLFIAKIIHEKSTN
jgi:hypothetical protein